jgi:hypothetical protein
MFSFMIVLSSLYIFEIFPVAIFIIEYIYMNIFMCTLGCQNKKNFTPCTILNTQSQNPGPTTDFVVLLYKSSVTQIDIGVVRLFPPMRRT